MKKQFLGFFIATNLYYISLHILLSHHLLQNGFVIVCMKGTFWEHILGRKHCFAWDIERDIFLYKKWAELQFYYFIIFSWNWRCPVSVIQQLPRITFVTLFLCVLRFFSSASTVMLWVGWMWLLRSMQAYQSWNTIHIYIDRYIDIKIPTGRKLTGLKVDIYLPTDVTCFFAFDHACGYLFLSSFSLQITGMDYILKYLSWVISKYVCCVCSVWGVSKNKINKF